MSPPGSSERFLVVGVGNRDRGDDGVGPLVADLVGRDGGGAIETAIVGGDLCDLALRWGPGQRVIVVDAMSGGRVPGTVEVIDGLSPDLAADVDAGRAPVSSHGVGPVEAIGLARALDRLPAELTLVLIEGAAYGHLDPLSDEVDAAAREVADRIVGGRPLAGHHGAEPGLRSRDRSGGSSRR